MNNTKVLPILFSTPMVQAILDGRKTQTGRLFKVNKQTITADEEYVFFDIEIGEAVYSSMGGQSWWRCPYGNVGDILWVRETWSPGSIENGVHTGIRFKADDERYPVRWKPSLFMPKEAARIFLKVTNVRVERLQDISEDDAKAEGIDRGLDMNGKYLPMYRNYLKNKNDGALAGVMFSAKDSFRSLWASINGPDSWQANPWVWIVEFKVLSTKGKPDNI